MTRRRKLAKKEAKEFFERAWQFDGCNNHSTSARDLALFRIKALYQRPITLFATSTYPHHNQRSPVLFQLVLVHRRRILAAVAAAM